MAETYHEPERRAGYTDEELKKHGDAVLTTWRDWVRLRHRIAEKKMELYEQTNMHPNAHERSIRRQVYDEIMREMDETQS